MTSIENPQDRPPAEGGDLPEAGPSHGVERGSPDEQVPLIGNTPDEEANGALRPGREQADGLSG